MLRVYAWCIRSICAVLLCACTQGEAGTLKDISSSGAEKIRLNQVGFYPFSPKRAVIVDTLATKFRVRSLVGDKIVHEGDLSQAAYWEFSGEWVKMATFSALTTSGEYVLEVEGLGDSYPFRIGENIHQEVHKASLKSYYFQRASTELDPKEAGDWARKSGHADTQVLVHKTAATASRPEGTKISASRGWYDAGDYGKYTSNAGYASWILMHLYEQFPQESQKLTYELPESNNEVPDILDEALWSLRWMLHMQDPETGMVYHKLTTLHHAAKVMPSEDIKQRYVIGKSTSTAFGYAAVMAQAARIFRPFETQLPGLADSCMQVARKAWTWASLHPDVFYSNPSDVHTGQYKDGNYQDEKAWAAVELFITTREDSFLTYSHLLQKNWNKAPGWNSVGVLAWMDILLHREAFPHPGFPNTIQNRFLNLADGLQRQVKKNPYHVPMGRDKYDFIWGSNGIGASIGMVLVHAYSLTKEDAFKHAAIDMMDYLLGRNATGYCFISGAGTQSPLDIHHRPSAADKIVAPVPGFLVGGPQGEKNFDGCTYPSTYAAAFYTDDWCSYSTNEVCLNWNAPFVYLSGALEFL